MTTPERSVTTFVDHVRDALGRGFGPEDLVPGLPDVLPTAADVLRALDPRVRAGSDTSLPLHLGPDLAVLAMVTRPGQATSIHDHVSWCLSALLTGTEREEQFVVGNDGRKGLWRSGTRDDRPGDVSVVGPDAIHRVTNTGADVAVSIHVYGADLRDRSSVRTTYSGPVLRRLAGPERARR